MKFIGDYKGYKVYQTGRVPQEMRQDTIYSVPSSSGYDAIYLGEKVGHFDHAYCVDWFSEEKVHEIHAMARVSTPAFSWSEPAVKEEEVEAESLSTDFWSDLTKKIDDILASVK